MLTDAQGREAHFNEAVHQLNRQLLVVEFLGMTKRHAKKQHLPRRLQSRDMADFESLERQGNGFRIAGICLGAPTMN